MKKPDLTRNKSISSPPVLQSDWSANMLYRAYQISRDLPCWPPDLYHRKRGLY